MLIFGGRASNEAQAREEAEILIKHCLKGKQFDYPIYYDVEDRIILNKSVQEATQIIKAWCDTMESHGYYVGIYMNQSCFNEEVKGSELAQKYSQWRAYWTTLAHKPEAQMWQYGGETNLIRSNIVAGLVCDQDYCYEDFPTIIKTNGLNGYSKDNSNYIPNEKNLKYKIGDKVNVSSYYASSTDDPSKAVIRNATGTITRIVENARNPYLLDNGEIGWVNDGDIRDYAN